MVLLLLAVFIVLTIMGLIIYFGFDGEIGAGLAVIFGILSLIAACVTISLGIDVSKLSTLDEMITMYEEENTYIETQIATAIENYQSHEKEVLTSIAPDSAITLIAMYPELKSDTLVQAQVDTYIKNNNKIKELKEQKIEGDVYRWWLYFGGNE